MIDYTEFDDEIDATLVFLNGFLNILIRVTGLKEIDLCKRPIDMFDKDILDICDDIYTTDMQYLYQEGQLDPY